MSGVRVAKTYDERSIWWRVAADFLHSRIAVGGLVVLGIVVLVHVLRNTLIPLVTVLGLELGSTIAYAVVTETIFAWPGAGKLILDSINSLDRPVVVAYLMVVVVIFVTLNLVVDLLYKLLDPRVRLEGAR